MKSLAIVLFICGHSVFALTSAPKMTQGYDLKMDLSVGGKHISSPRVTTIAGKTAMLTQKNGTEESFIEVIAAENSIQDHKGIMMKFKIGTIDKNGTRTVTAQSQVLTQENEPARITVDGTNGAKKTSFSVVPKRINL